MAQNCITPEGRGRLCGQARREVWVERWAVAAVWSWVRGGHGGGMQGRWPRLEGALLTLVPDKPQFEKSQPSRLITGAAAGGPDAPNSGQQQKPCLGPQRSA